MNFLKQATAADDALQMVKTLIIKEWPAYKRDTPTCTRQYWPLCDELHIIEGLLFTGESLVIPPSVRHEMLTNLHESHLGIEKCKARERFIMYWPRMGWDIEETKSRGSICAKYKPANPCEPLIPHVILERPWSKLGIDIFTFRGRDYLLDVDYFFRCPDVYQLSTKTASRVFSHLKTCFETHGKLDIAIADNMPFGSNEFAQFSEEWSFEVETSSRHQAPSNGKSERSVGTIRQLTRKHQKKDEICTWPS